MDGLRIDGMVAQHGARARYGHDQTTRRGQVRFWKPGPELSDEFDCAYLDGGMASAHIHEDWQFAVAGQPCAIAIGAFRRYIATPEDVTVVQPYDAHTEHGMLGGPRDWWVLHVAPRVIDDLYGRSSGHTPQFDVPVVQDRQSARALVELLQANRNGSLIGQEFGVQAAAWVRGMLQHARSISRVSPNPAPVSRARAYLQVHATEPVLLADLAGLAGVTTSHFVRSFSRKVGLPPRSYQTQIRLARARRLLAEGKPATWVAYECGFADQSHLSRRFKEFYGLTPGNFQAQYQAPLGAATETAWDVA